MTDDSAEILSQSFLQVASVSNSGMGRDVHSLLLSIQHFLCGFSREVYCIAFVVGISLVVGIV